MDNKSLWQVRIGEGLGPLALGAARPYVADSLQEFGIQSGVDPHGDETRLKIRSLKLELSFAEDGSGILKRIHVRNPQVSFASWDVIGKPIHKVVRFFKCSDEETLWCSAFDEASQQELALAATRESNPKPANDIDLLRHGTLWIPALGLGFTVDECRIVELHVTSPEDAPKFGTGTWNIAQKTMSERGKLPKPRRTLGNASQKPSLARSVLTFILFVALGIVAWQSIDLQQTWNAREDVSATVIGVIPPPPEPFGNQFQLRYEDEHERIHEVTMDRMDFFDMPKLHSVIKIRYLPDSPEKPLGDRRLVDVGMNYGLPRAGIVVAVYAALLLLLEITSWFRSREV